MILFFTSTLVIGPVDEMPRSLQTHLVSVACILPVLSVVSVHDSQVYSNIEITKERISQIFKLSVKFLQFQMSLIFVSALVVSTMQASISGFTPSCVTIAARYLPRGH